MNQDYSQDREYHPLLKAFVEVAPYFQMLVNEDITIGIYDTEKLIQNFPAKTFSLNVTPGILLLKEILSRRQSEKTKTKRW